MHISIPCYRRNFLGGEIPPIAVVIILVLFYALAQHNWSRLAARGEARWPSWEVRRTQYTVESFLQNGL